MEIKKYFQGFSGLIFFTRMVLVLVAITLFAIGFIVGNFQGQTRGLHMGYEAGYKTAWNHYKEGKIDCFVYFKYPKWLEGQK